MSNKIHTQFDPKTNQRLDQLFTEWTLADNRAAEYEYGQIDILFFDENGRRGTMSSQPLVDAADNARRLYDTLMNDAKLHRQPHQITAGVYNSTLRFDTPENAQKFTTSTSGTIDGTTVKTQAALIDVQSALIQNDLYGGMIRSHTKYPVNMQTLVQMQTASNPRIQQTHWSAKV
jgi:hypothetical protein